jgi:pyruvate ferredoxin oxidoreductase gamma subunit
MAEKKNPPALPVTNDQGFYEMRFESIGGLGANLAAQLLAEAAVLKQGFNGANFSSYGAEKKGSPVQAFIRLCAPDREVRSSSPVEKPHLLALFNEVLHCIPGVMDGVDHGTTIVVNGVKEPALLREAMEMPSGRLVVVDALGIALDEKARLNTAMLGAISRAVEFLDPEALKEVIRETFSEKYPRLVEPNMRTFDRGYQEANILEVPNDGKYSPKRVRRLVPGLGYETAPIGGAIVNPGNTVLKDLSPSRGGYLPSYHRDRCIDCGLCEMTCPDYVFVFEEGVDKKGRPAMIMQGPAYQYCKGCLKCTVICPTNALTVAREEDVLACAPNIQMIGPAESMASFERGGSGPQSDFGEKQGEG